MSQTNKQSYIGLTIGPIFPTLEKIRSTRALFSGSYIFSWLMREIVQGLIDKGLSADQILTPSTNLPTGAPEAGYYADRLIIAAQAGDFDQLLAVMDEVLQDMAKEIEPDTTKDAAEIERYLHRYFQLYCFEYEFPADNNPFKEINNILNGLELHKRFPDVDEDWFVTFLNRKQPNFLIKDAFGKSVRFRSIVEITTGELKKLNDQVYQEVIDKALQQGQDKFSDAKGDEAILKKFQARDSDFKDYVRSYHKYVAVVHADGDGIGTYIGTLDDKGFKDFSDQLFEFSQKAKDAIKAYGGAPIFIGGDDMLFLAPVAAQSFDSPEDSKQLKTVFHLIQDLDALFQQYFPAKAGNPTFSYGISFTYYKFPLNEARALSYGMEERAKKSGKNAVAFQLRKHSGANFESVFSKDQSEYDHFVQLVGDLAVEKNFLSTLIHRFGFHRSTLEMLLKMGDSAEERLEYFFDNNFDEAVHRKEKAFFKRMVAFLQMLYRAHPETALDKLNATLRFIHFLRSTEDEE